MMHEQACYCDKAASHHLPIAAAFWIIWIVSAEECSSLMQNLIADLLLYLLSHFECDSRIVHMLTQWRLPPPLASTVRSSLFMHVHSSPLSLAARLHWCRTNRFHYINNGWTFSGQTLYMWCATAIHQVCNIVLLYFWNLSSRTSKGGKAYLCYHSLLIFFITPITICSHFIY